MTHIQKLYEQVPFLPEEYRAPTTELIQHNERLLEEAHGSRHNHQAWRGGYIDHIAECLAIAHVLYPALECVRSVHFALDKACLALFYHDLEKPWRHAGYPMNSPHSFRLAKLAEYGMTLSADVAHAIKYTHGEGADYRSDTRVQTPLAAFVHCCDTVSARIWHDYPSPDERIAQPRL